MAGGPRPPRIFVGPIEIAGYYTRLAANLREVGADAVAVDVSGHPFRYERGPRESVWIRIAEAAGRFDARFRGLPTPLRIPPKIVALIARVPLFLWALTRFDVFIFGFGHSFFHTRELPLLHAAGKSMIFVFNGSDARPPYIDGALMRRSSGRTAADCIRMTRRQKDRIKRIERYAHAIVSQPAFSHFFERPVADFFRVGVPWIEPPPTDSAARGRASMRVLHSPSDPEVKGTDRIRAVVQGLVSEGRSIDLVEIRGQSNDAVRREIAGCDFVIDQIYSDAPMVGFATEAAVGGKPAIVGGYAWTFLRRVYDDGDMPPVEQCRPEGLRAAIVRLADDVEHRRELESKAQSFVRSRWARSSIAERYLALIGGTLDPGYFFDPSTIDYVAGVGFDESDVRTLVAAVIAQGGREALQLSDKPALEQKFVEFAGTA